jgi:hypothetical protein
MRSANAINVHRKSGVAERRDLRFLSPRKPYKLSFYPLTGDGKTSNQ